MSENTHLEVVCELRECKSALNDMISNIQDIAAQELNQNGKTLVYSMLVDLLNEHKIEVPND